MQRSLVFFKDYFLLALKWAVTERYHDYLYGNSCTVLTDNNPLTYVLTSAKLDTTGHRWLAALANYDLKIKYRPGSSNRAADALSILPGLDMAQNMTICQGQSQHADTNGEYHEMSSNVIQAVCHMFDTDNYVQSLCLSSQVLQEINADTSDLNYVRDWRILQRNDPIIHVGPFVQYVTNKQKPLVTQIPADKESQSFLREYDHLKIVRGVLYRVVTIDGSERRQLVLPKEFRQIALKGLHDDIGHMGRDRTIDLVM